MRTRRCVPSAKSPRWMPSLRAADREVGLVPPAVLARRRLGRRDLEPREAGVRQGPRDAVAFPREARGGRRRAQTAARARRAERAGVVHAVGRRRDDLRDAAEPARWRPTWSSRTSSVSPGSASDAERPAPERRQAPRVPVAFADDDAVHGTGDDRRGGRGRRRGGGHGRVPRPSRVSRATRVRQPTGASAGMPIRART